jgi:hypothetical protein
VTLTSLRTFDLIRPRRRGVRLPCLYRVMHGKLIPWPRLDWAILWFVLDPNGCGLQILSLRPCGNGAQQREDCPSAGEHSLKKISVKHCKE